MSLLGFGLFHVVFITDCVLTLFIFDQCQNAAQCANTGEIAGVFGKFEAVLCSKVCMRQSRLTFYLLRPRMGPWHGQ